MERVGGKENGRIGKIADCKFNRSDFDPDRHHRRHVDLYSEMNDLQTAGIIIANLRRKIRELELECFNLRETIETIICAPGTYEFYKGKSHPLNEGSNKNEGEK